MESGSNKTPTLLAGAGEGELKLGYKLETLGYKMNQTIKLLKACSENHWKNMRIIKSNLTKSTNPDPVSTNTCRNKDTPLNMFFNFAPEKTCKHILENCWTKLKL